MRAGSTGTSPQALRTRLQEFSKISSIFHRIQSVRNPAGNWIIEKNPALVIHIRLEFRISK
jgi:hypothetical protein